MHSTRLIDADLLLSFKGWSAFERNGAKSSQARLPGICKLVKTDNRMPEVWRDFAQTLPMGKARLTEFERFLKAEGFAKVSSKRSPFSCECAMLTTF